MDAYEISKLASVLRENGDQVLNGQSKLTLSTTLLTSLNQGFALVVGQRDSMNSSFQVLNNTNAKVDAFSDLQFLHDFVQRSGSLKLIPNSVGETCSDVVDISKFKNLKLLELYRVNIKSIVGLQSLRGQLQFLICIRSLSALDDVLVCCGADNGPPFVWRELREGVFSHNGLYALDNSLEYTPWLHTLDLSHNNISSVAQLNCLCNLKHLNLNYNKLESVPEFTGQLCNRLQVLYLKGNFIEDVKNVSVLSNLCELDLGDNCLLEHSVLSPLSCLAALKWLSIENNPLSYHPLHRMYSASCLHVNTITVRFVLDRCLLSKSEQKLVGTVHSMWNPSQKRNSFDFDTSESTVVEVEGKRVRNATISDATVEADLNSAVTHSLTASVEHLETKRQIQELREKFGASWLQQQAGAMVQDVLGLEKTPLPVTSSPYETDFLLHAKEVKMHFNSTEIRTGDIETTTPDSAVSDNSVYAAEDEKESSTDEEVDLGDGDESLFLCTKKNDSEQIFLVVTKSRLSEREVTTSKEITHWHVHTLTKCEQVEDEKLHYVRLEFDTLRRDRKVREYILDEKEMARLIEVLKKIIEEKPNDLKKVTKYQCMKCSSKFSKDTNGQHIREKQMECPSCESTLVIEDDS